MTPHNLREEANAAESLARLVSYGRDKERLTTRAAELRRQAEALEHMQPAPAQGRGWRRATSGPPEN